MSIEAANAELEMARQRAELMTRMRDQKAQVMRLDEVVEEVEASNLENGQHITEQVWDALAQLADRLPVPAPPALWSARTGSRLHSALLDWQGAVLDYVAPQRSRFADRHD